MGEKLVCSECGDEVASMEELEAAHKHEVPEFEEDDDGGFKLYGNDDLFLCKNCKNPLGIRRKQRS